MFLKDKEANFLLAANAGGRMPVHLQMEYGFEAAPEISSLESEDSTEELPLSKTTNSMKRSIVNDQLETKKLKSEMSETFAAIKSFCKEKKEGKNLRTQILDEINRLNIMINDRDVMGSMTPTTRETYTTSLQMDRKNLIKQLSEMVREQNDT